MHVDVVPGQQGKIFDRWGLGHVISIFRNMPIKFITTQSRKDCNPQPAQRTARVSVGVWRVHPIKQLYRWVQ